ncbi:hypothetical protein HQ520_04080 [bacterium]|nr:hypothetical protein [bacterium]
MATIFQTLHPEKRATILAALRTRIEKAIEQNEDLTWKSLLGKADGFINVLSERIYRGWANNLFLAVTSSVCGGDPRFLTYPQIQSFTDGKGRVRAGEKLTPIFCPLLRDVSEPQEDGSELKKTILRGYRVAYVANVRQTNLIEIGAVSASWHEGKVISTQPIEGFLSFVERIPFQKTSSLGSPFYNFLKDEIGMPSLGRFREAHGFASALAHELTHWTGHGSRLNRPLASYCQDKAKYSTEELTAELGAIFLLKSLDIDLQDSAMTNSAAYLKNWLTPLQNNMEMLVTAAAEASRATQYLTALANGAIRVVAA